MLHPDVTAIALTVILLVTWIAVLVEELQANRRRRKRGGR